MDTSLPNAASGRPPNPPAPESGRDRPIFVVGCPRSGTTLLQLMLHAHPRIAIPPETRHLLEVYRDRATFGDLGDRANRERLARAIVEHPRFADLGLDQAGVATLIVDGPPTLGSALGIVLREYAGRFGKPRWGDKRPLYLNHLDVILGLFPDAQIVNLIRDGRANVASLKRMPWWDGGAITAMSKWIESMERTDQARATLRPDQYCEVRYEALVADPRTELERVCAFLGEDFSDRMLEPHHLAPEAVPAYKTWHEQTRREVSTDSVATWTTRLEPWELHVFEKIAGRWLRRYGYEPTSTTWLLPPKELAKAQAHVYRRRQVNRRNERADRATAAAYPHPLAAQLTSEQLRLAAERGELR